MASKLCWVNATIIIFVFVFYCINNFISTTTNNNNNIRNNNNNFFLLLTHLSQIGMEDTFGEVMKRNLHSRGLGLVGVEHCGSLQSQLDRCCCCIVVMLWWC